MIKPIKVAYVGIAMLAILASLMLLSFFNMFQQVFKMENALSTSSPIGIMAIIAIIIFGGIYFFNIGINILNSVLK